MKVKKEPVAKDAVAKDAVALMPCYVCKKCVAVVGL